MKNFHPLSFGLGLGTGLIVLALFVGGLRMTAGNNRARAGFGGNFQQFQDNPQNVARMAQRFGMTEADLQKELDDGKSLRDIAQEHGVQFGARGAGQAGSAFAGGALGAASTASSR